MNLTKDMLISVVRQLVSVALGSVGTWAADHGLASQWALLLGAAIALIVNIAWALGERLLKKWQIDVALVLPANSTHADVEAVASAVPVAQRLKEAAFPATQITTADLVKTGEIKVERP